MISVVIPVCNMEEYTNECIDNLQTYAHERPEIIIIDNNSTIPYARDGIKVIRNNKNIGFWPSMLLGMNSASNDVVLTQHNDVFVWEEGYDQRIQNHFEQDQKLAIAGYFGARGVGGNGARLYPESNMLAKKYGTHGNLHGNLLIKSHPSLVFDSLSMIFQRKLLTQIDYASIPPHHWTDRLVTLRLVREGYHARTIGIGFDHGGGFTSSTPVMNTFTQDWCTQAGLEFDQSWDYTLYQYGMNMFAHEFFAFTKGKHELWVQSDYSLHMRG